MLIQRYRTEAVPSRGGGGGVESLRAIRISIIRPGEPIQFSPLVLPPVAAERIIRATRRRVAGGVQVVRLLPTFDLWVRSRCRDGREL